jgi:hypothetical protein
VCNSTYMDPSLASCKAAYPMEPTSGGCTNILVCQFGCVDQAVVILSFVSAQSLWDYGCYSLHIFDCTPIYTQDVILGTSLDFVEWQASLPLVIRHCPLNIAYCS